MDDAPQFNDVQIVTSSELSAPYNKFDLYVEDSSIVQVYRRLVQNLVPTIGTTFKPLPLSGRNSVIDHAAILEGDNSRPRLFVIDGDADYVVGKSQPLIKNLHVLGCYSIENLILDLDSLCDYLSVMDGKRNPEEFSSDDYFVQLENIIKKYILPVSIFLCVLKVNAYPNSTTTRKIGHFVDLRSDSPRLRKVPYLNFIRSLKSEIVEVSGLEYYNDCVRMTLDTYKSEEACWERMLTGKYSKPTIFADIISKFTNSNTRSESAIANLVPYCNLSLDSELRDKILSMA